MIKRQRFCLFLYYKKCGEIMDITSYVDINFHFLGMRFSSFMLWIFIYSFLGWCMECIVIRRQLGYWENRGFVKLPFCIIYGIGCAIAIPMFAPIRNNIILLYFFGAFAATMFEFLTAKVMQKLFGKIWWDYSHLRYNYKGILCLESTLGWGCLAVFIVGFFNDILVVDINKLNSTFVLYISSALVILYVIDFGFHFYKSITKKMEDKETNEEVIR